ncbi:hypothetical protein [Terriglobus tenax]|uniref:hypothetical protein n=1 Tax=Terriglobus tenax TaxID=1111115 RepID=UPI0021DFE6A5|nr:hypothetical protein [Terriglobus tenax]
MIRSRIRSGSLVMLLIALALFLAGCLLMAQQNPRATMRVEHRAAVTIAQMVLSDRAHEFRVLNTLAHATRLLEAMFGRR